MKFLEGAPRFLFFTGKGGVGKTSLACATAIALAETGRRVLLVSTDPASNVGQVFGVALDHRIQPLAAVKGLDALEIDPLAAARAYRDRIVGPVRGILPDPVVQSIEEQLSGACTTEIAAFDEFTALLTDAEPVAGYDHIVFDTAPTGHTLRLLRLPGAWSGFLEAGQGAGSCLGPLAGLAKQRSQYRAAVEALADASRTRLILVARAQAATLREVARSHEELAAVGLRQPYLVINGILPAAEAERDPLAVAVMRREQSALADLPASLLALPCDRVALKPFDIVGLATLRQLFAELAEPPTTPKVAPDVAWPSAAPDLGILVDRLAEDGHGLVMLMGKGGVGKTTLAAAIAVALARRGFPVHLTTSDPAAHLAETLPDTVPGLAVSRIDPELETARYRAWVLETKGRTLDEPGRALLEEDLRSPCTEEIAVFQAFSRIIGEADRQFVVMDTAPTGHTLLLLDATGAYHREVVRQLVGERPLSTPLERLQDPRRTKVLIATLAETTPVLEAARLQADLRRAGIEPWAWIINQSLAAARTRSVLLRQRALGELTQIEVVAGRHATRLAVVAMQREEPIGAERLQALAGVPAGTVTPQRRSHPRDEEPRMNDQGDVRDLVRRAYAQVAQAATGGDAPGCCGNDAAIRPVAAERLGYGRQDVESVPAGAELGLGCGNPLAIAALRAGETVLDLGSGGGFDCFLAARQVGDGGRVIGVDMTPEMLDKARANAVAGGYRNVEFRLGEIEHLPVADGTVDVILSNCVINLSVDKRRVFAEAWRVLKPGGRLAIADVVATAELPAGFGQNPALHACCVAGAASLAELEAALRAAGFEQIEITPKDESRSFIRDWAPGVNAEAYVVSAFIQAVKPVAAAQPRLSISQVAALVAIGAAIGADRESALEYHIRQARALGVSPENLLWAVKTARSVREAPAVAMPRPAEQSPEADPAGPSRTTVGVGSDRSA